MSDIKINVADVFKLQNPLSKDVQHDPPTLICEAGVWDSGDGMKSGVLIATSGELSPLVEPQDVRRLAKWLNAAADEMTGEKQNHKRRKNNRHYEEDEDNEY